MEIEYLGADSNESTVNRNGYTFYNVRVGSEVFRMNNGRVYHSTSSNFSDSAGAIAARMGVTEKQLWDAVPRWQ